MKKCANWGFESPDETLRCPACSTDAFVSSSPEALGHIISPEEQRFWERMTFRHFAIFFIRLQALWFILDVFLEITYLLPYLTARHFTTDASMIVLRGALYLALAIVCLRYADRIVSWFVKDVVPRTPPNTGLEPAAATPSVSDMAGNQKAGGE